ncbi:MAG: tryptophan halogenase [Flavobacteriales bacterium]|jgi:tryptophan halogenase
MPKKKVVVAGGGTSGWLAAAGIAKLLGNTVEVSLIESAQIGRIGVGEATIPTLRLFHRLLGIDEAELMAAMQATIKLGIEFQNWGQKGDNYFHSFGTTGKGCWACDFPHFWLAAKQKGLAEDFSQYSLELMAARQGKAAAGDNSAVNYAYHLDAGLYAEYLKKFSIKHGVNYIEGTINNVVIAKDNGYIESLELDGDRSVGGDLFIDCTGFSARLIEGALNTSYISYSEYLPCDSAVAIQTELTGAPRPYTQAIAHDFGWQWRIPLQHRTGNGLVYSSRYVSDDEALATLMKNLESPAITEPRSFKYNTGRREKAWNKNCIAVGLAAGFLEPVESTSIHLAMSAVFRLLKLFPIGEIEQVNVDEYNRQFRDEMDLVKNFVILHYAATERDDTAFWRYCKGMELPAELTHRINLFRNTAACPILENELFTVDSWAQVMMGQGIHPNKYHTIVDVMTDKNLAGFLKSIKADVDNKVAKLKSHQAFLDSYCKADKI